MREDGFRSVVHGNLEVGLSIFLQLKDIPGTLRRKEMKTMATYMLSFIHCLLVPVFKAITKPRSILVEGIDHTFHISKSGY